MLKCVSPEKSNQHKKDLDQNNFQYKHNQILISLCVTMIVPETEKLSIIWKVFSFKNYFCSELVCHKGIIDQHWMN